jgi:hypothetical protein
VERRQLGQLHAPANEERAGRDEHGIGLLTAHRFKSSIDLSAGVGVVDLNLQSDGTSSRTNIFQLGNAGPRPPRSLGSKSPARHPRPSPASPRGFLCSRPVSAQLNSHPPSPPMRAPCSVNWTLPLIFANELANRKKKPGAAPLVAVCKNPLEIGRRKSTKSGHYMQTIARSMADTGPMGGRYMPHAPPIVGRYGKRPLGGARRRQGGGAMCATTS